MSKGTKRPEKHLGPVVAGNGEGDRKYEGGRAGKGLEGRQRAWRESGWCLGEGLSWVRGRGVQSE